MNKWYKFLIGIAVIITILLLIGRPNLDGINKYTDFSGISDDSTAIVLLNMGRTGKLFCSPNVKITLFYSLNESYDTNLYEICEVLRNER